MLVLVVRLGRFFGICWGTSFSLTNLTAGLDESDPFCHQAACGDCLVSLVMPHEGRFCWRCWGGGVVGWWGGRHAMAEWRRWVFFYITPIKAYILLDTVDASELLHFFEVGSFFSLFTWFYTSLVQDFFQQYVLWTASTVDLAKEDGINRQQYFSPCFSWKWQRFYTPESEWLGPNPSEKGNHVQTCIFRVQHLNLPGWT